MKMFWSQVEAAQYVGAIDLFGIEFRRDFLSVYASSTRIIQHLSQAMAVRLACVANLLK
jgi:hypothetical protein